MMTVQEMKDKLVREYGFENPGTVYFFKCCEEFDDPDVLEVNYYFALDMVDWD